MAVPHKKKQIKDRPCTNGCCSAKKQEARGDLFFPCEITWCIDNAAAPRLASPSDSPKRKKKENVHEGRCRAKMKPVLVEVAFHTTQTHVHADTG